MFFHKKSKEQGYGKLSSDEDLEIIVDQKQVSEHSICFLLPVDFDLVAFWVQSSFLTAVLACLTRTVINIGLGNIKVSLISAPPTCA